MTPGLISLHCLFSSSACLIAQNGGQMWRGSNSLIVSKKGVYLCSRQRRFGELTWCIMVHVGFLGLEIFILSLSLEGRQKSDNNQQEK